MPKASKNSADAPKARHNPLGQEIDADKDTLVRPRTKKQRRREWERGVERERRTAVSMNGAMAAEDE